MKYLTLSFLFLICIHFADAQKKAQHNVQKIAQNNTQNNDWFTGSWYGIKSFTGARIGIKVLVRIEVDSVKSNRFTGRFIYMYPKDTLARLVRTFNGNIKGSAITLDKSKEIYLLDPRSRSFWSNCASCNETASVSFNDTELVFKITTTSCDDSCNGESVFTKSLYHYDSSTQTAIKKIFTPPVVAFTKSNQKNKNTNTAKKSVADTGKNNQPLTKLNNKKNVTDSVAKNVTTTQARLPNKDSLTQAKTEYTIIDTNHVNSLLVTSHISSNQKNKNINQANKSLADTGKNDESSTKLNDKKSIHTTDSVAKNIMATQTYKVAETDALLADTGKAGQSSAKLNNEKLINTADSVSKAITSTQTLKVANTDTLAQAKINRKTDLVNSYKVNSSHIEVELFDNGEIDSDAVSVYYNNKLIINNATLTYKPIMFSIDASATNRHHEFILIAENEGLMPPNTALMRITAGDKQYKLTVSTSDTKNAKIAIDYTGE